MWFDHNGFLAVEVPAWPTDRHSKVQSGKPLSSEWCGAQRLREAPLRNWWARWN